MKSSMPKFIVRYFVKETLSLNTPPTLRHAVFYEEEDLLQELPKIRGNYSVYEVGKEYESKSYFDKIFADEKLEKERQEYLKLKAKFDDKAE